MQIIVKVRRVIEMPADKAVIFENLERAQRRADEDENTDLEADLDRQMHELIMTEVDPMIKGTAFDHVDADVDYDIPETMSDLIND